MKWDRYFHNTCKTIAEKSPCLSRQIGSLLVRDNSIISTGFNGPPRGIPHCGYDRAIKDEVINHLIIKNNLKHEDFGNTCPRRALGYPSGTHMELCSAQHAEENAVSNAARLGVSILNSSCYLNSAIPCHKCFGTLINAGIAEIVVEKTELYDEYTKFLMDNSNIKIRKFDL